VIDRSESRLISQDRLNRTQRRQRERATSPSPLPQRAPRKPASLIVDQ